MDTLENNVRSECKQAFAELQTDMTDLTMDLETSGIPLLDHRTFVMKVFFPGVGDHPLFLDPRIHGEASQYYSAATEFASSIQISPLVPFQFIYFIAVIPNSLCPSLYYLLNGTAAGLNKPKTEFDAAMLQFEGLLNNKWFLLAFIETMERQKSFTIRDRVNFASLLTIILMTKMEYLTDILR